MTIDLLSLILLLNRFTIGGFFILARFRYVFDPYLSPHWFNLRRRESLTSKMRVCGFTRFSALFADIVAYAEIAAGIGLIVGLLTQFAALGLGVILVFATLCNASEKIGRQTPIDRIHCLECYMWCPEPLYIILVLSLLLLGAGTISVDHLIGL